MTELTKVVKRSVKVYGVPRAVAVILDPETKSIGFQEKGCRRVYWLPILTAFTMAVMADKKKEK